MIEKTNVTQQGLLESLQSLRVSAVGQVQNSLDTNSLAARVCAKLLGPDASQSPYARPKNQ